MTLVEFLGYAGTAAGINVIIGFLLSFVVEWFPEYEKLAPRWKRLTTMGLSFVIPLLSVFGLYVVGGQALSLDVVWVALSAGFACFFGTQAGHARELSARPKSAIDIPWGEDSVSEQRMLEMAAIVSDRVVDLIERRHTLTDKGQAYVAGDDGKAFKAEGEDLFGE